MNRVGDPDERRDPLHDTRGKESPDPGGTWRGRGPAHRCVRRFGEAQTTRRSDLGHPQGQLRRLGCPEGYGIVDPHRRPYFGYRYGGASPSAPHIGCCRVWRRRRDCRWNDSWCSSYRLLRVRIGLTDVVSNGTAWSKRKSLLQLEMRRKRSQPRRTWSVAWVGRMTLRTPGPRALSASTDSAHSGRGRRRRRAGEGARRGRVS